MQEPEDTLLGEKKSANVFVSGWPRYNQPTRIVTLGHYYPQSEVAGAKTLLREARSAYVTSAADAAASIDASSIDLASIDAHAMRRNLGWTQLIAALNQERQWPIKRLFAILDPMLEPDIAIAVVPTHLAYQAFWPVRTLARQLAERGRVDATSCLVRHTTIRRIMFGGPSTTALHRQSIRVENASLIEGRRVLLLDDVAKSGASLVACRTLLLEAGAALAQAMALGRVIIGTTEPPANPYP